MKIKEEGIPLKKVKGSPIPFETNDPLDQYIAVEDNEFIDMIETSEEIVPTCLKFNLSFYEVVLKF